MAHRFICLSWHLFCWDFFWRAKGMAKLQQLPRGLFSGPLDFSPSRRLPVPRWLSPSRSVGSARQPCRRRSGGTVRAPRGGSRRSSAICRERDAHTDPSLCSGCGCGATPGGSGRGRCLSVDKYSFLFAWGLGFALLWCSSRDYRWFSIKKFLPVSAICSEEPLGCWKIITCSVLCLLLTKQPHFS